MKFCKDCAYSRPKLIGNGWFKKPTEDFTYAKCYQRFVTPETTDMVTGEVTEAEYYYCSTWRESSLEDSCGPNAQFFEAR